MPTLRRIWLELGLVLAGLLLLMSGLFAETPYTPTVRSYAQTWQPIWGLGNLVDHTRAFALRSQGFPAQFDPVSDFLLSSHLTKAPSYYTCVASIPLEQIEARFDWPLRQFTNSDLERQQLAQQIGAHFLRQPGDFVYLPYDRVEAEFLLEDPEIPRYKQCLMVLLPWPENPEQVRGQDYERLGADSIRATPAGPYLVVSPRNGMPPVMFQQSLEVSPGHFATIQQRGTRLTIQLGASLPPLPR